MTTRRKKGIARKSEGISTTPIAHADNGRTGSATTGTDRKMAKRSLAPTPSKSARTAKESCCAWLLEPQPGVNYDVVWWISAVGVVICVAVFVTQIFWEEASGWWIIFAPYVPALAWQSLVRTRWLADRESQGRGNLPKQD